ncbi:MAG: hypothetical protein E6G50_00285, partial [Actinobacteria bacterium]
MRGEPRRAPRAVERCKRRAVEDRDRVRRAVTRRDDGRRALRELVELFRTHARDVAVDDRDRPRKRRERADDVLALTARPGDDQRFLAERIDRVCDVFQHRERELRIAEPRLPAEPVRDQEVRHAARLSRVPRDPDNATIAERLEAFAALLDLAGSGHYTSRAYRRAAETIRETKAPIAKLVRQDRVQDLRGIGPGIAKRLHE